MSKLPSDSIFFSSARTQHANEKASFSYYSAASDTIGEVNNSSESKQKRSYSGIIKLKCVAKLQVGRGKKMIVCGSGAAVSDVCCS